MLNLKRKNFILKILVFTCAIQLFGCKQKIDYRPKLSFYFWKQKFVLSDFETTKLEELKVKKLYAKMFDVVVNHRKDHVVPVAMLEVRDTLNFHKYEVIPCVFIDNRVFNINRENEIDTLAAKILYKIKGIVGKDFGEIHIDCDWTKSTKLHFFYFLRKLSKISSKEISCTIRLHQIKYVVSSGIPPVSKGVLMCYNMGVIQNQNESNSIFDIDLVKNYTKNLHNYPIKLDIALPIFSWNVVFRDNKFLFIHSSEFSKVTKQKFKFIGGNKYKCISSTRLGDKIIMNGDILREEAPNEEDIKESILLFSKILDKPSFIFYHLNKSNLEKYEKVIDFCADN